MSTQELLIAEINHAPEDVLQRLLRYLRSELQQPNKLQTPSRLATTGPYADYWNQFIGAFANEEWERLPQDEIEEREVW